MGSLLDIQCIDFTDLAVKSCVCAGCGPHVSFTVAGDTGYPEGWGQTGSVAVALAPVEEVVLRRRLQAGSHAGGVTHTPV